MDGKLKRWWRRLFPPADPVRIYLVGDQRQPVEVWATGKLLRRLGMTPATFGALVKFNSVRARCPNCAARSGDWDARYEDEPGHEDRLGR